MSIWGVLGVIFLVVQFILENYKKSKKNIEEEFENIQNIDEEKVQVESNDFVNNIEKSRRRLVDREEEILENPKLLDKDTFVQDYIMAEILSKPKSKK